MLGAEIRVSKACKNRFFFFKQNLLRVTVNGKREKASHHSVWFELD